jgi:hypothetical protein
MEPNVNEIFLNQYPKYIANNVYTSHESARNGCRDLPGVKTIKFIRVPEEVLEDGQVPG